MAEANAERQRAYRQRGTTARRALAEIRDSLREGIALATASSVLARIGADAARETAWTQALDKMWAAYHLAADPEETHG